MRLRSSLSQTKWAGSGINRDERGEVQIMTFPVTHKCLWHFRATRMKTVYTGDNEITAGQNWNYLPRILLRGWKRNE